jgi:hypothetical protein
VGENHGQKKIAREVTKYAVQQIAHRKKVFVVLTTTAVLKYHFSGKFFSAVILLQA